MTSLKLYSFGMATLKELVKLMSVTLGDPEKSVSVLAMHLRKAKLLSSTGRGLHSARMRPSDATNMLIACLHIGKAKDSAAVVARIREAQSDDHVRIAGHLVPVEEMGLPTADAIRALTERHTLGAALDAVFEELSSKGEVREQITGEPYEIHLDLRTTAAGWSASLSFQAAYSDWQLLYKCLAEPDDSERSGGHKEITVRIPNVSLKAIANCIGHEHRKTESLGAEV